jgi:hypothetical protein
MVDIDDSPRKKDFRATVYAKLFLCARLKYAREYDTIKNPEKRQGKGAEP